MVCGVGQGTGIPLCECQQQICVVAGGCASPKWSRLFKLGAPLWALFLSLTLSRTGRTKSSRTTTIFLSWLTRFVSLSLCLSFCSLFCLCGNSSHSFFFFCVCVYTLVRFPLEEPLCACVPVSVCVCVCTTSTETCSCSTWFARLPCMLVDPCLLCFSAFALPLATTAKSVALRRTSYRR